MSWRDEVSTTSSFPEPFTQTPGLTSNSLADNHAKIVIIGAGRAGLHITKSLSDASQVVLFDAEPWAPYDRVRLSNLLSREATEDDVFFNLSDFTSDGHLKFVRRRIVSIDRRARFVQSDDQHQIYYEKLVLCLGSSARRPPIPGINLKGVHTFRDLGDSRRLIKHAGHARHAVIIGGGYLGLETASGLCLRGLQCAVVETQNQLMPGQLEATAADQLKVMLERLGVSTYTGRQVQCIEDSANGDVSAVRLDGNEVIKADMVVVCAGVMPNIALAREAGLDVRHGILVDDSMRTSDPFIYAAGECAEHKGRVYGLVGPVIEQAEIVCEALRGGAPVYCGSVAASSLKIAGIELFVAGDLKSQDDRHTRIAAYHDHKNRAYRTLAMRNNRIVGGIVIGPWTQTHRLRRAIETGEAVESRQLRRFSRTGQLWSDATYSSVTNWPCEAFVCNCCLVTKGAIDAAIASGAKTREKVSYATGAAKNCGSCKPLIDELLGLKTNPARTPVFGTVGIVSFIVLVNLALFLAAPPWPVSPTISPSFSVETLWLDGVLKQATGFALLGSVLIAALLFLRKRTSPGLPGSYENWRLVHAGFGGLMIMLLFAHTGFSLGSYLNSWLMASFLATLSAGAFAGLAAGLSGRTGGRSFGLNVNFRRLAGWLHILVAWPLPLLLLIHILMVYYF